MLKVSIVILLIFNILACKPIQQASLSENKQQQQVFSCLASQTHCDVNTKFGLFSIQFSGEVESPQGRVKTELPFQIKIRFDAVDKTHQLKGISSYLEGKTMFMGKIPVFFQKDKKENNVMVAETLLASCSEDVMTWRLWIEVEITSDDNAIQQNFFIDFDSKRL